MLPDLGSDDKEIISEKIVTSKEGEPVKSFLLSKQFRDADADVTITSSDGVRFQLHKRNLALYTGGFPPLDSADAKTRKDREKAKLSERAIILNILFGFIYPQRYPDLEGLEIGILCELAEAAEKYEVYAAISVCQVSMKYQVPNHPLDVFGYAVRYNYLDLMDRAVPLLLGTPFNSVDNLPVTFLMAWYRYLAAWDVHRVKWVAAIVNAMKSRKNYSYSERNMKVPSCGENCNSEVLVLELTLSMLPKSKLLELAETMSCQHCRLNCISNLIEEVETVFANFPKFRTFLAQGST